MAEQSMILRPTASAVLSSVNGNVTFFPSDTASENAYLLVNEAEADNDATYVTVNGLEPLILFFTKPQATTIVGVKLHCCVNSQGTKSAFGAVLAAVPAEGSALNDVESTTGNVGTYITGWASYAMDYSNDTAFIEALNNNEYTQIEARCVGGTTTNAKPGAAKYTQVYLELIYDDGESTTIPLYLRENGAWTAVEGTVYQKVNGAWVESNTDVFQDGDSYQLVTV